MPNINIGGVQSDLVLDARRWVGPLAEAIRDTMGFGQKAQQALTGFESVAGRSMAGAGGAVTRFGGTANQVAREIAQSFMSMSTQTNTRLLSVSQTCQQVGQALSRWSSNLRSAVETAAGAFLTLDQKMHDVDAIAKLSKQGLADLTTGVRATTREMGLTSGPSKLADTLKQITGAGYQAKEAFEIMRAAGKGADAGETMPTIMSGALVPAIKSFGLAGKDSMLVMDQLFKGIDQGNLSAEDMAREIGGLAPVLGQSGSSMQEMVGALAYMTTKGQSASENATQLQQAFLHLVAPTRQGIKTLQQYGVEAGEAAIRSKGLIGVLKDLYAKTGGDKIALKRVLDVEGLQAAAKLIGNDKGAGFQTAINKQFGADGATDEAFRRRAEGFMFQFNQLKAAFEDLLIGVGSGLGPAFGPVINWLNKTTQALAALPDKTKGAIAVVAGLASVAGTVTAGLILATPTLLQFATTAQRMGTAVAAAASDIGVLLAEFAAPLIAIGAQLAVLYVAWQRDWGGIREFTREVTAEITEVVKDVAAGLSTVFGPAIKEMIADFSEGWGYVKEFAAWFGEEFFVTLIGGFRAFLNAFKVAWETATGVIRLAWAGISPVLKALGDGVKAVMAVVALAIEGDWNSAWNAAVQYVSGIGERIKHALQEVKVNIKAGLAEVANDIRQAMQDALSGKTVTAAVEDAGPRIQHELRELVPSPRKSSLTAITAGAPAYPLMSFDEATAGYGGRSGRSSSKLTPAQMLAYIRSNSRVYGDIAGLDQDTLKATYQLVKNSVIADFGLQITSAKRHGSGGSFHNSGRAVDIQARDRVNKWDDLETSGMIQRLTPGTGFRSGINEFMSAARPYTKATGPHMHLTTGLERTGADAVPGAFLVKGGGSGSLVATIQAYQKDLEHAKKLVSEYMSKPANEFQAKRLELRKEFDKATEAAKLSGADEQTLSKISGAYRKRIAEVNDAERKEAAKTASDLTILRLEAEGKMGEAASARIQATADQEKQRLADLLKLYPQLKDQITATNAAIDENATRQIQAQKFQQTTGRVEDDQAISGFRRSDPGMAGLMQQFPQFRAEIEAAYASLQAYIQQPAEQNRATFQQSIQMLQTLSQEADNAQQKKLANIDFERQMGSITAQEAIARQAEVLNNWVGNEDSKRQMMLQMRDTYRENFEQQLELQGDFSLQMLEDFAEKLQEVGNLTAAQQAQLAAANSIIIAQRIQDQQTWQGVLNAGVGHFQTFLTSIMSGQQTMGQAFTQLWKGLAQEVIAEIAKMIAKATVLLALQKAIGLFTGGIGEIFGGVAGSVTNLLSIPGLPIAHTGGRVVSGGIAPFTYHTGGMVSVAGPRRSDEVLAMLQTDELVLNRQQTANLSRTRFSDTADTSRGVHIGSINIYQQPGEDQQALVARIGRDMWREVQGAAQ